MYKLKFSFEFCKEIYLKKLNTLQLSEEPFVFTSAVADNVLYLTSLQESEFNKSTKTARIHCTLVNTINKLEELKIDSPTDNLVRLLIHVEFKSPSLTIAHNQSESKWITISCSLPKEAVDSEVSLLNLKLSMWRHAPDFDIDGLISSTCTIFGVGSLGCYTIRCLLSYGIQKFILIDNSRVSSSTVKRQSLYDLKSVGKRKVDVAEKSIKNICSYAQIEKYHMTIPTFQTRNETVSQDIVTVSKIVRKSDAVFLLTDNRESRWLPTLFGKTYKKRVFTSAIGFDTFVCIEHSDKTGCYFCNDIIAPRNSKNFLSQDQKCTISIPGIPAMASGIVTEMFAAPFLKTTSQQCFHIRCFGNMQTVNMDTKTNSNCVACSQFVISECMLLNNYPDCENIENILQTPSELESKFNNNLGDSYFSEAAISGDE